MPLRIASVDGAKFMQIATDYRQQAKECRAIAIQLKPGNGREQLMSLALRWEALAANSERRSGMLSVLAHRFGL